MENPFEILMEKLDRIEDLLLKVAANQEVGKATTLNVDEKMNVKQVGNYLSLQVSTIYSLCHRSEIPNYKRGKRLYFKKSDIDEWISKSRRKTYTEIEEEANNYILRKKR